MTPTLRRFVRPVAIIIGLFVLSWIVKDWPTPLSIWLRIFMLFVILVLLARGYRRNEELIIENRKLLLQNKEEHDAYRRDLHEHRAVIIDFIDKAEQKRQSEVEKLVKITAELAAAHERELAAETAKDVASSVATTTSNRIEDKLDTLAVSSHQALNQQTKDVLAAVERGTLASAEAAEVANNVNIKIVELREDLKEVVKSAKKAK